MVSLYHLLYSFLLPLFILVVAIFSKWLFSPSKTLKNLPPSPGKLPIIGNLHQLGSSPHRSLQALSKKHGPLMLLHFGRVPVVVASSADASREIMKTHDLIFANRAKSSVPSILSYNARDIAFADYGEYWRQIKSIAVLQLLSQKRVQSFRRMREEETDLLVERIIEIGCSSSPVVNMSELLISLTNGVICRSALGRKHGGENFKELFVHFVELLGVFSVGDYIPWLSWVDRLNGYDVRAVKVAAEFDAFLEGVIEEHVERKKRTSGDCSNDDEKDFVDILLDIQNQKDASFVLDRDTVKALILDVFTGGTDTTYSTLEWELSELLRNPHAMKKLQEEVREVAKGKPKITEDDLDQMLYLKAVVKETFRMHTPLPLLVPRESTKDVKVMGYDIAAGTQVLINAWAVGRDPCSWDEPEQFRPERFLDSPIDYKGFHFELTPFGAGRRKCPGIQFAMNVNELVLASLVHRFDFELPDAQKWEDLDMSETTGITIHKKLPLLVVATPYV
ncbi:cytochrome P450 [Cynara cardunculus var. scolymus]|uniref:Cytochrome P450 n=2 Tax=Cynara cardunculus var. scolymus TaxID=59895 RepID=A0A103XWH5_CYNCS|nr:cytochrome P450 [Cynara cardunculus var. scolymus]